MSVRQWVKRTGESLLRVLAKPPRSLRGRALVLAWHNVVPDGDAGVGDQSLHLRRSDFLGQLDILEDRGRVISLADLLAGQRSDTGPVFSLTFDDAYRGACEFGLPELTRRGLPCTVFVTPGLLGRGVPWWDAMAGPDGLDSETRIEALHRHAGRPPVADADAAVLPPTYRIADEPMLHALGRSASVHFGAHTWSHPNLTRISEAELREELGRPLEWLRGSGLPMLSVLAYPYGLSSAEVAGAAAAAGYQAACRVEGGWVAPVADRFSLPRFNIPAGLSADGFLLRLSGALNP